MLWENCISGFDDDVKGGFACDRSAGMSMNNMDTPWAVRLVQLNNSCTSAAGQRLCRMRTVSDNICKCSAHLQRKTDWAVLEFEFSSQAAKPNQLKSCKQIYILSEMEVVRLKMNILRKFRMKSNRRKSSHTENSNFLSQSIETNSMFRFYFQKNSVSFLCELCLWFDFIQNFLGIHFRSHRFNWFSEFYFNFIYKIENC